ncbi:MAG: DUF190 domain-containing protein [Chlorobi bacterium]|uniref:Uncharacterized protein n=1 Tax=hydrothermal vent metagenome TaxID=652676 RepID=A0A3B0UQ72_9ZZZZ|nr:DUF190 domain-containing protein [Chlorobiota bacterium]
MKIKGSAWLLKIYTGEGDKVNGRPLYEEIVFEARKKGLAGATVTKGLMSYGASHSIHTMKIFALSSDLPIIIEVIDKKEKLQKFIDKVNELFELSKKGGLVTLQPLQVIMYRKGEKYIQFNSF